MFSARGIIVIENKVLRTAMGDISGDGIVVANLDGDDVESSFTIGNNEIEDSARCGILVDGMASGAITNNKILRNSIGAPTGGGGVWLQYDPGALTPIVITGNEIADNEFVGINLTEGAAAMLAGNTVSGTIEGSFGTGGIGILTIGDGLGIFAGSFADVAADNSFNDNERMGVITDEADEMSVVRGTVSGNARAVVLQGQTMLMVDVSASGNGSDATESLAAGTEGGAKDPLGVARASSDF